MGFFSNIAKRKTKRLQKSRAAALYKRRDAKLDKAISEKKVTDKQKKALGKGGTKKYRDKFGPRTGVGRAVRNVDTVDSILKDIRGGN